MQTGENVSVIENVDFQGEQIDLTVLDRLKANIGNISPVIQVFLDSLPQRLAELHEAISASEHEEIRRLAHTIKGSSSQFGAIYLSILCFEVENMGKNKHLESIDIVYEKICQAVDHVAGFLQEQLDK